eukprot:CAMPEP_0180313476 /NCGR_PEP_ID=MMETSP0988-20121125/31441_1 /TAXON_ID=697907 /ORGANISM="non described non described, Strain CCMP2293" /LENGTH=567 /DNA_ID=CAMNT_0022297901 /DNA_START=60 /DNA_END=1759 /DNA_ORIENTATION=+
MTTHHHDKPKSRVLLTFECKGLQNKDTFSKSDPQMLVHARQKDNSWKEVWCSEKMMNNLNPEFKKKFETDYMFEEVQNFRFQLYDIDNHKDHSKLEEQDFLGMLETTMGEIVGSRGSCLTKPLVGSKGPDGKKYGFVKILAEEISSHANDTMFFQIAGSGLSTQDWVGKGDKFVILSRKRADGQLEEFHRTEVIKNNKNPVWAPFELNVNKVNAGKMEGQITMQVMDWNTASSPDYCGEVSFTAADVLAASGNKTFTVTKPQGKAKDRGTLVVQLKMRHEPTFLEFIAGGTKLSMFVAIDFTASNGAAADPASLHHMDTKGWNQYQQAIIGVGEVLDKYNSDKTFDCFGFGAKLPTGEVSHCFALNGDASNPKVAGVQGILEAYQTALTNLQFYGPTNFASIIKTAAQAQARVKPPRQDYMVLLIITDGAITDMDETVDSIIAASGLPLSIIIVGVGPADFGKMETLDGDDHALTSSATGKKAQRDIVQFVAFRDLKNDPSKLATEVLYEIPAQLTSYMKTHNMTPMQRPTVNSHWEQSVADVSAKMGGVNLNNPPPPPPPHAAAPP